MSIKDLISKADNYRYSSAYSESELIELVHDYNDFYASKSDRVEVPSSVTNYSMREEDDIVIHEFYAVTNVSEEGLYTIVEDGDELVVTVD